MVLKKMGKCWSREEDRGKVGDVCKFKSLPNIPEDMLGHEGMCTENPI